MPSLETPHPHTALLTNDHGATQSALDDEKAPRQVFVPSPRPDPRGRGGIRSAYVAYFHSKALTLLLLGLWLSGCASQAPKDPASPYFKVPPGSILTIKRKIEVPPGSTRVFFQNGKVSPAFNHYAANCNIEVNKLDEAAVQYVEVGEYRIVKVQRTQEEVVRSRRIQLAALSPLLAFGGGDGGEGSAMIYEGYDLWLESADPNVRRLSCRGAFADPHEAYPPSIDEIRQSLGAIMTLQLME